MKALHDIKEPLEELNNMVGMKILKNIYHNKLDSERIVSRILGM